MKLHQGKAIHFYHQRVLYNIGIHILRVGIDLIGAWMDNGSIFNGFTWKSRLVLVN